MLSASPFILPARPFRVPRSGTRTEFRSSYFKNTPPIYNFSILEACQTCLPVGRVAEWGAAVPDLSKNSNGCRIFRHKSQSRRESGEVPEWLNGAVC